MSGLTLGLTLGLMSLALVDLEVLMRCGTPTDRSTLIPVEEQSPGQHQTVAEQSVHEDQLVYVRVLRRTDFYLKNSRRTGAMGLPAAEVKIILGSSSQTRRAIMKEMGLDFEVMTADIDESSIRMDKPEDLVMALAKAKAQAILARMRADESNAVSSRQTLLITADQVVVHEGNILEKPRTKEEARRFIEGYSRSPARTVGAVLVTNLSTGISKGGVDTAEIYFHTIPENVITTLIEEGSVFWAAGGLLVEHPLVSPLVNAMVGTMDSVMGLPKDLTLTLITEALQKAK